MKNKVILGNNEFEAVLAVTEQEQSKGLMGVPWPPPVMAFPYNNAGIRKFWMHNTPSPLDIIFCCAGKVIAIVAGEPLSTRNVGPDEPCDLVVEMPRGTAQSHGITVGTPVKVTKSIISVAKSIEQGILKKYASKH
jgi:hypothetical protein